MQRKNSDKPWPWPRAPRGAQTLLVAGDTNICRRKVPAEAFTRVLPTLRAADVFVAQLEGLLAPSSDDPGRPDIPYKASWRHPEPRMIEGLRAAGLAAVSCASNVAYGEAAILHSLGVLDQAGIAHAGAGRDRDDARKPAIVMRAGVRYGLLSYTSVFWPVGHAALNGNPGVATIKAMSSYQPHPRALEMPGVAPIVHTAPDPEELRQACAEIQALRRSADVVLVACHWGVSGSTQFTAYQQTIGRALIDAGADLVYGHHPHVLQGIEVWRGRPIFYSLGNFAFDQYFNYKNGWDGLLVRVVVHKKRLQSVAFVPARRDRRNLVELHAPSTPTGRDIVGDVIERSETLNTRFTTGEHCVVLTDVGPPHLRSRRS